MAGTEFFIRSPYNLANFAIAANVDGTRSYWSGTDWDVFASVATYSLTADTQDGLDGFTGSIPAAILDALTLTIITWETGVTNSLANQADSFEVPWTGFEIGSTGSATVYETTPAAVSVPETTIARQDFEIAQGAIHSFEVTFTDSSGAAISYSGHMVKMVVSDLAGTWLFQNTGVVSGTGSNIITVTLSAANTTTALSSACDGTSLRHYWQDITSGDCILMGALIVRAAVAAH